MFSLTGQATSRGLDASRPSKFEISRPDPPREVSSTSQDDPRYVSHLLTRPVGGVMIREKLREKTEESDDSDDSDGGDT